MVVLTTIIMGNNLSRLWASCMHGKKKSALSVDKYSVTCLHEMSMLKVAVVIPIITEQPSSSTVSKLPGSCRHGKNIRASSRILKCVFCLQTLCF